MSPPKASLSSKEPLKPTSDEILSDKGDGAEFPSVIVVETEQRARNFRRQIRRRRCRLIIFGAILVIIVAVSALLALTIVNVLQQRHNKSWTVKSSNGAQAKVTVDEDNNLIHAAHGYDSQGQTAVYQIMHEYGRKLVVYKDVKDVKNYTCYIDRLDETFQDGYERWESYKNVAKDSQTLKVISELIEVEVLQHIGYIHIYGHCKDAKSYWVMEIEQKDVTTEMRVVYV